MVAAPASVPGRPARRAERTFHVLVVAQGDCGPLLETAAEAAQVLRRLGVDVRVRARGLPGVDSACLQWADSVLLQQARPDGAASAAQVSAWIGAVQDSGRTVVCCQPGEPDSLALRWLAGGTGVTPAG
ncbi:hypothetical protein D4740_06795 [Actinomyces sp. 2119]|uniref:Uncharacterized protein n=1 Tax=Actinomyces lilanjuaniae TaxID=2321394 RepID=A0ABM6Z4E6_9ACTO|nr:hypothetical protein D5R93_09005 [Actinomyces lilanjuaniae]RJF42613.1 hypothetical protein D4740_06795 [Actinomyces sp. 2119]